MVRTLYIFIFLNIVRNNLIIIVQISYKEATPFLLNLLTQTTSTLQYDITSYIKHERLLFTITKIDWFE